MGLLIISCFISATFLRLNSIGMDQRRDAVINADKAGNEEMIIQRLYDLQQYISRHMNTDLGRGVYLENSYNRDLQNWQANAYGDSNPNGNIYKKAQEVCAPKYKYYSYAYLRCTTDELAKYPAAADPASDTSRPRAEAYIHNFVSPVWTPDFAGWSVFITAFIALLIIIRITSIVMLQIMLKRQFKRV